MGSGTAIDDRRADRLPPARLRHPISPGVIGSPSRGKIIDCPMCLGSGVIVDRNGKKWDCWGCGGSGKRDIG